MNNLLNCQLLFAINDFIFKSIFDDIKCAWDVLNRLREYTEALVNNPPPGYSRYGDGVIIGHNVEIASTARIDGPTVIADASRIRHGAYIRGSVILGKGCVVGNSSEVKNSLLLDGAQAPHFNYVGDSILGNRAHLGAGAICSNLRSDGKGVVIHAQDLDVQTGLRKLGAIIGDGVEIGCGAVLCPGTVIGKNSTVYPLTLTRGCYPEDSIVKDTYRVVKKEAAPE